MSTFFFNNFKIDKWWKGVLWLSIFFMLSSFFFSPSFLKPQHLFGLGLSFLLIGISYWISDKTYSWIKPPNAYTGGAALMTQEYEEHNFVTIILLTAGVLLFILFGFLIIKNLI
jgi:hypothetical protein